MMHAFPERTFRWNAEVWLYDVWTGYAWTVCLAGFDLLLGSPGFNPGFTAGEPIGLDRELSVLQYLIYCIKNIYMGGRERGEGDPVTSTLTSSLDGIPPPAMKLDVNWELQAAKNDWEIDFYVRDAFSWWMYSLMFWDEFWIRTNVFFWISRSHFFCDLLRLMSTARHVVWIAFMSF